jgi:hypothetical protein
LAPTTQPPVCECHGVPKLWNIDPRCKAGGFWRCAVKNRLQCASWYERNALAKLMYEQRTHHRDRLRQLTEEAEWPATA